MRKINKLIICLLMIVALYRSALSMDLDESLLQRYGVKADELTKTTPALMSEPVPSTERFPVEEEKPAIQFDFHDKAQPEPTENISIDSMNARDLKECLRVRNSVLKHRNRYVKCNNDSAFPLER